jgi:hypothetical protein
MGWGIAANWAIVVGSVLLTIGTGAQARASLAEYRDVLKTLPEAIRRSIVKISILFAGRVLTVVSGPLTGLMLLEAALLFPGVDTETAVRLAQLARLTIVWTIIMAGSALVLAGAAIQLALTYTG